MIGNNGCAHLLVGHFYEIGEISLVVFVFRLIFFKFIKVEALFS